MGLRISGQGGRIRGVGVGDGGQCGGIRQGGLGGCHGGGRDVGVWRYEQDGVGRPATVAARGGGGIDGRSRPMATASVRFGCRLMLAGRQRRQGRYRPQCDGVRPVRGGGGSCVAAPVTAVDTGPRPPHRSGCNSAAVLRPCWRPSRRGPSHGFGQLASFAGAAQPHRRRDSQARRLSARPVRRRNWRRSWRPPDCTRARHRQVGNIRAVLAAAARPVASRPAGGAAVDVARVAPRGVDVETSPRGSSRRHAGGEDAPAHRIRDEPQRVHRLARRRDGQAVAASAAEETRLHATASVKWHRL